KVVTDIGGGAYDSSQPYWGNDEAHSVALQSDGKILVGGFGYVSWATDFTVARYNADFRLDSTFGAAGIATTNLDLDDEGWTVALQPDGKILLGGHDRVGSSWGNDDFAVVRYDSNGILDTATFNPGGGFGDFLQKPGTVDTQVRTDTFDLGRPMALQGTKIVLAGPVERAPASYLYQFGVARYLDTGQLDTTFNAGGTPGTATVSVGASSDWANAIVVDASASGYILLAGASTDTAGGNDFDFSMVRYQLDGTLDASFGAGGKVKTDLRGGQDWGAGVAVQSDGKIVMAGGSIGPGGDTDFAVVRYVANGTSLDASFGSGGMAFTPMAPGDASDEASALVLQPDGKIVVVGGATNASGDYDFAVVRYNTDGSLDTSFGFGGKVTTPIGGGDDVATAVVLQPDGRIVVVGHSYNTLTQDTDFAMVRYNADGSLDNTCGQVFYSIGTNTGNLATGSPSVTITSGTATLTAAQTNDVGVGDVIDYGTGQVFISAVVDASHFRVHTATGDLPVDFSGPVSSIKRAFNSVSSAVTGSVNASHLNTGDLVALEKGLTWVSYNDGPLNVSSTTTINGYTTNDQHFITLTAAAKNQVVTGNSQRHRGIAGSGVSIQAQAGSMAGGAILVVNEAYTVVEWLEVDGNSFVGQDGIVVDSGGSASLLRHLVVHDIGANDPTNCPNGTNGCSAVIVDGSTSSVRIRNCFIYDYGQDGIDSGGTGTSIANTTLFRTKQTGEGLQVTGGTTTAENVLSVGNSPDYCAQDFCSGTLTANNNISSDDSADNYGGAGNLINRPAASQFASLVAPVNLHLRGGSDAIDAGKSLSTYFTDDIDGNARPQGAAWDVGADESFLSAIATNYRSIGTAANLVNQGTITVTAGSAIVTKSGGLGWRAQNRGRGDVLIADGKTYMIASVSSDDSLTLASLPTTGYIGGTYTIARQFATLAAWEDCIDGPPGTDCLYFPVTSASLVADDRSEIGIAYNDSTLTGYLFFDGSTTDASHTITLTVDPGNRHTGVGGTGTRFVGGSASEGVSIRDDYVTLEWLDLSGSNYPLWIADQIANANHVVVRNNVIHDGGGPGIYVDSPNAILDIHNNVISGNNQDGIWFPSSSGPWAAGAAVSVVGNTIYYNQDYGIISQVATNAAIFLRNNLVTTNAQSAGGQADFQVTGADADYNLSGDGTAAGANSLRNVPLSGAGGVNFVDSSAPFDLHLQSTSQAIDQGADLSALFTSDIDGATRSGAWDIGADEFGATTAVRLMSFAAVPGDSSVTLEWRTGSELDNLGFHLYRGLLADGPWTRLTSSLIPGLGSSPLGQAYSWQDTGLVNGTRYYYRLEDVDTASRSTLHGPVSTVPSAPAEGGGDDGGADGTEPGD
ncbi:MAG: right-handed parallel beta-helix repeat-containing protein, partial [Acidobacteria bacterium]|nr:right-handed parallel beta-helix repeat-containing protein [Acidobacteriota bacterium]